MVSTVYNSHGEATPTRIDPAALGRRLTGDQLAVSSELRHLYKSLRLPQQLKTRNRQGRILTHNRSVLLSGSYSTGIVIRYLQY